MKRILLCSMLALALAEVGCGTRAPRQTRTHGLEVWLANYIGDQQVGYSVYRMDRTKDGFRFESSVRMTLAMAGRTQRVTSSSETNTGPDLALRDFEFSFGSEQRSFKVTGLVTGSELRLVPAGGSPRTVKIERQVFPVAALGRLVHARKLSADSVYRVPVFDAAVLDVVPAEVRVMGREKKTVAGREYECTRVVTKMARLEVTSWIDDDGMVVIESSPPNMRSERVDPKALLSDETGGARVDVLTMFRVPVDTVIVEPGAVSRLKIEVTGIDPKEYDLTAPGQRLLSESPLALEIEAVPVPDSAVTLPVAGQAEFLRPSVSMPCDDGAVTARAAEVVGRETDAVAAARKLVSWVFTVVEKQATASFPTALDVLKTMKGDCNEHAVLLGALARAAGVPAKVAVGLVYMDGAFYYHAWNEVWLGRWVPVDATFGEFPASAVHLKLAEGELSKQAEILGVVGNVGIKVLEFDRPARR